MKYDVHIQDKNKIVLCVCKGMLDLASAKLMARDVRKRAFELGYGLLYDVTNVSLGVTIADAYFFPRNAGNIYEDLAHRSGKAAIVYKSDKDYWKFYETTSKNAGVNVLVFCETKEALEWLSEE
jgi:hypothetical protein